MRALARDLAVLGIERRRARVAVDALDVDLAARRARRARASAARQASRTAPVAIQVMREADAEPAEPTVAVVCGRERDVLGRELVRATCSSTEPTPWPTSAAAQCTTAPPSARSTTRAAQKSSKPSEKQMFL